MPLDDFLSSVRRHVLPNGLTLLTRPHTRGGVVAITTWVKAGYFHEPDDVAGMAHLFEHMFFKGSRKFPGSEEIAQHVSSLGGSTNAGTIYDNTNYYFVMPREGLVRGIEIQADAILHPLFDPEELRKEAEVVIEESNRKLDNPPALATERMFATAFTTHRMKRWRIGSHDVLRDIRRDDLMAFFETLYRPENIIVAVVGDVDHQEVADAVERTFGQLPRGVLKKERGPSEPEQREFRFAESRGDIRQSYSVTGWHTPGEKHADEEALEVLASILGSGRFSRLYRNVVGPDAASGVSTSNSTFEDVGIFMMRITVDDDKLEVAERKAFAEIERMRRFGPTGYECQLARNRIEAGFVFELDNVLGQAQTLAIFESRGSYADIGEHLSRLMSVTPEQIREVASRYLRHENATLYRYRPASTPLAISADVERAVLSHLSAEADPEPQIPVPPPPPVTLPGTVSEGVLKRFVLSNGISLFVREAGGTPDISFSVYFRGGRQRETSANAGITQLMARSLRRGTAKRTGEQIDREIEFLGTGIGVVVEEDYFGIVFDALRKHFPAALEIIADVVMQPTFPEEGIEEERHLQLASIRRSLDSTGERPFQLFYEEFYRNHPYGFPDAGFSSSVENLTRQQIEDWYRQEVVADAALIVAVGDIDAEKIVGIMEQYFGKLAKSSALRQTLEPPQPPGVVREVVEVRDRKQSAIVIGFPTVPPQHDDWTALRLMQDITSGLSGTFFAELRGRQSLAYTVFAGDSSRALSGAFVSYIATDAAKEDAARKALFHELRRLGTDGFTEEDLARAKSYLAGSMKIRLQTNRAIAAELAQNYLYQLGVDFIDHFLDRVRSLTLEEVRGIAKRYLTGDNYTVAILRGQTEGRAGGDGRLL